VEHQRIYALYGLCYTPLDFTAASLFLSGSVFFFWRNTQYWATWLFVVCSICFTLKPAVRLMREVRYLRMGRIEDLARREEA
jgi:hypothetical protein